MAAYAGVYLREEVQREGLVRNLEGFSRFLEVKNLDRVRSDDLKGFASFRDDYPEAKVALLYRGKDRLLMNGIPCLPCENFLLSLNPSSGILP